MEIAIAITVYVLFGIFSIWFADKYAELPFFKHENISLKDVFLYMFMLVVSPAILFVAVIIFMMDTAKNGGSVLFKRKLKK
jgi:hypothetical protein